MTSARALDARLNVRAGGGLDARAGESSDGEDEDGIVDASSLLRQRGGERKTDSGVEDSASDLDDSVGLVEGAVAEEPDEETDLEQLLEQGLEQETPATPASAVC